MRSDELRHLKLLTHLAQQRVNLQQFLREGRDAASFAAKLTIIQSIGLDLVRLGWPGPLRGCRQSLPLLLAEVDEIVVCRALILIVPGIDSGILTTPARVTAMSTAKPGVRAYEQTHHEVPLAISKHVLAVLSTFGYSHVPLAQTLLPMS